MASEMLAGPSRVTGRSLAGRWRVVDGSLAYRKETLLSSAVKKTPIITFAYISAFDHPRRDRRWVWAVGSVIFGGGKTLVRRVG